MGHTLLLGCGGVGSCTVAMLSMLPSFNMHTLTIIDHSSSAASSPALRDACARGATFLRQCVTRDNWRALLAQCVRSGDAVIDLTFGINSIEILEWCQQYGVRYINTAIEKWEDELIPNNEATWIEEKGENGENGESGEEKEKGKEKEKRGEGEEEDWTEVHKELYDRTLYARHLEILEKKFSPHGPTAVLEHGCNPGLVSHFVRAALDKIVEMVEEKVEEGATPLRDKLRKWKKAGDYAHISMALGLRNIHISEIDTQTAKKPKPEGSFVNTWSPMGFAEESLDWVQVGWGTHERDVPRMLVPSRGTCNQIFVPMHAMDLVMHSYVPHTPIKGMCIPHGEADTITEHLTVYEEEVADSRNGHHVDTPNGEKKKEKPKRKAIYRPSTYYVYQCSKVAMESLDEMRRNNYIPQSNYHVLTPLDDGLCGEDRVGVLLMFEDDPIRVVRGETEGKKPWTYWYGSIMSEANNPLKNFNPTVVQVAVSVVAAFQWALENPNKGVCWPDDLPHNYILDLATPLLGSIEASHMKDYSPPPSLQFADFICKG